MVAAGQCAGGPGGPSGDPLRDLSQSLSDVHVALCSCMSVQAAVALETSDRSINHSWIYTQKNFIEKDLKQEQTNLYTVRSPRRCFRVEGAVSSQEGVVLKERTQM